MRILSLMVLITICLPNVYENHWVGRSQEIDDDQPSGPERRISVVGRMVEIEEVPLDHHLSDVVPEGSHIAGHHCVWCEDELDC